MKYALGNKIKAKTGGGAWGYEILSYICVTLESCLCSSDVIIDLRYFCRVKMTPQIKFSLLSPSEGSIFLVWIKDSHSFHFLICVYSNSLTANIPANVAGALVFYLFREFAYITYIEQNYCQIREIWAFYHCLPHIWRDFTMAAKINFGVLDPASDPLCIGQLTTVTPF